MPCRQPGCAPIFDPSRPHDLTRWAATSNFDHSMLLDLRLLCVPEGEDRPHDASRTPLRRRRGKLEARVRLESDLARCIEYGSTCPTRDEAVRAFAVNERAMLSVPKSRRHIMNISDLSSIHAGPLAEFLGKEWRWGNPDKPIPHKAVYYASRACLGGNHPAGRGAASAPVN